MRHSRYAAIAAALVAACMLQAGPALAQRVFVSAQGADANPCTFALPCRTFQHAHDVAVPGGEIDVLDPAGYGALTISKSISIQGHGFAGISVSGGNIGIRVSAAATDDISLNGLLIDGAGAGTAGIVLFGGKSLVVADCVVRNMTVDGLALSSSATTLQTLSVSGSLFTDNGNNGILIHPGSSGAVTAAIDHVAFYSNHAGGLAVIGTAGTGAINVAVTDSVAGNNTFSTNGTTGFFIQSASGHSVASLVLTRVTVAGNTFGIGVTGTNATLRLTQSTVTGNGVGYAAGGTIVSYGDNVIDDNIGANVGTLTGGTKQ